MKKLLALPILLGLSIIQTALGQTPSPTINGTPPPFTFTGAGVVQSGQTFTFGGGGSSGFPITLGSTSVAASSTTTSISGLSLVAPALGAATATSLLATGIVDGVAPITITTGTSCTLGTTSGCNSVAYNSGYTFNQNATAATAVAYTLPTAAAGKQFCIGNSYNGSAANTGVITLNTSASGQFIIFTDGTLSATGGNITSGGAAADAACVVGLDSTHWQLYVNRGTWTKH